MLKLTPRQAEILAFIKRCLDDNGYPPTRAEIALELGFKSPNAAEEHLKALARKGDDAWRLARHSHPRLRSQGRRIHPADHWPGRRWRPHPRRAACRGILQHQPDLLPPSRRLPATRSRHEHEGRRYFRRRSTRAMARSWWHASARKSPSNVSSAKAAKSGYWRRTPSSPLSKSI